MKAKSKGGGSKSAAKEVTPAIPGLGRNVPAPVRDAYLAVVKSEPQDRLGAVAALHAAMDSEQVAGSYLALAKALVYRAMDAAMPVGLTKKQKQDPFGQLARDEDVVKLLEEATAAATKGSVRCDSHLCFMLAARLLAVRASLPINEKFEEEVRSLIERPRGPLLTATKKSDLEVTTALQNGLTRMLQKVEPSHEAAAGDVIAEDAWPFELLACSSAENMGLMMDYAKALLRQCTAGILDRDHFVNVRTSLMATKMTAKLMEMKDPEVDKNLGMADAVKRVQEARHFLTTKYKDVLPLALAVTIYAPRAAALRLAKFVNESHTTKVKDLATMEHWARHAKAETSKVLQLPMKELKAIIDGEAGSRGAAAAAAAAPAAPAVAEKSKAKNKSKPAEETRISKKDEEKQQKRLKAALASAKHRANVIKRYLDRKASEKKEKDPDVDIQEVIQDALTMDFEGFYEEMKTLKADRDTFHAHELNDFTVVSKWVTHKYPHPVWYSMGPRKISASSTDFCKEMFTVAQQALDSDESAIKARDFLIQDGILVGDKVLDLLEVCAYGLKDTHRPPVNEMALPPNFKETMTGQARFYIIDEAHLEVSSSKHKLGPLLLGVPLPHCGRRTSKKKDQASHAIGDSTSDEEFDSDEFASPSSRSELDIPVLGETGSAAGGDGDLEGMQEMIDLLKHFDDPSDMYDSQLLEKILSFRILYRSLASLREWDLSEPPAVGLTQEETALIGAARPAISGFATVAAFTNPQKANGHFLARLRDNEFDMMDDSLPRMLFYAANYPGDDGALLTPDEADNFVAALCMEIEAQESQGRGSSQHDTAYWSMQCVRLLLARAAGLKPGQKVGAVEALMVKEQTVSFIAHGLALLLISQRLTAAVARDIAVWVASKMDSFQEHFKDALALLAGRVLPRIWEKELEKIEKAEAAEKEKKEEEENAAKAKEAEERANALLAEEEAAKTKKEAAEVKKKKKKAKKAAEEPAGGAVAVEEKGEEEEEAAAPVEEQEEEEEAAAARGDDDEGMGDLIGMFAARGVISTAPHAATAPPPTGGPREKAPAAKVVSWDGKWQCRCHRTHTLDSSCSKCEVSVCQAFVEGRPCRSTPCKKVHPAFSISTRRPPPSMNPATVKVRNTTVWSKADKEAHAASRQRSDRMVGWMGERMCSCEEKHGFREGCATCGAEPPCRDALRGACRHGASCKFPHLPLDLEGVKKPRGGKDDDFIVKMTPSSVLWRGGALVAPAVPGAAPEEPAAGNGRRARGKKAAEVEAPRPRVVEVQRVLHVPRRPASAAPSPAAAVPAEPEAPAVDSGVSSEGWGFAGAPAAAPARAQHQQYQTPSLFPPPQDTPAGGWPAQGMGAHAYGLPHAGPPAAAGWEPWASASLLPTTSVDSEVSAALPLGALDFQTPVAPPAADDDYDDMLADLGVATEPPAWRAAVMASVDTELSSLAGPGLTNEAGEYNCFLNVVVQCLWHCFEFRKRVMSWPPEVYSADPVVHALRSLFGAFAELEASKEGGTSAAARRAVVDPAELRQALAAYPGGSFGLGEMNDAAELLMTLYGCAQEVGGAAADAVDAVFGLRVRESVSCPTCRASDGSPLETHQNEYVQYFFNVSATALRTMRAVQGPAASTAFLLRRIEEQTQKSCDTDKGGCDARLPVRHTLTDPPAVFTLQLAWETTAEAPEDIRATMEAVQELVRLQDLYADVQASSPVKPYKLRAAVAYYGAHYSAIVYSPSVKGWVMLDDASVSKIGRWDDVVRKCQAGRIQPSVLFYVQE